MELEGSLRAFSLPEVLQFLSMGKMSGVLRVKKDGSEISLVIKEGKIVNSSTLQRTHKLGQMLVYRGILNRGELEEVLSQQQSLESDKLLGQILIERELVSPETLKETVRLQLEEEIWDLFSWQDGDFKFEQGADAGIDDVLVEIEIEPLLIEGSRRLDEWSNISKNISDETVVVKVPAVPNEFKPEATIEEQEGLRLSDNEWRILSLVNGRFDVRSIINRGGLGKFETYRILNSFMGSKLLYSTPRPSPNDEEITELRKDVLPEPAEKATSNRKRSITSFLKSRTQPNNKLEVDLKKFHSAAGLITELVNNYFTLLLKTELFILSNDDYRWLMNEWEEIVMMYVKSDIIIPDGLFLNGMKIEKFFEIADNPKALKGTYEDCLEALGRLLKSLHNLAIQRLGKKEAGKTFSSATADISEQCALYNSTEFELTQYLEKYTLGQ